MIRVNLCEFLGIICESTRISGQVEHEGCSNMHYPVAADIILVSQVDNEGRKNSNNSNSSHY